jgi:glycerol transport system ATP-binding protein
MLEIKNLFASSQGESYLEDVSFTAEAGKIYVLMGRTGAGKTSFMRAIGGLLPLDSGSIHFGDEEITSTPVWKRDAAIVYQQFINYPNKTVRQNVEFPLRKLGLKGSELNERVDLYISKVGLTEFAKRRPSQLSGGQQQRVALARSLARQSRILMLDEPLMNLDFKLREQLREEFLDLFSGESQTVTFYATTEITEAMMLGYEVLVMHEGKILQSGTPDEVFERPKNTLVAGIINDPPITLLDVTVVDGVASLRSGSKISLPDHLSTLPAGDYMFGIRANDLEPSSSSDATQECTISFVELSGSETVLYLNSASGDMVAQIEGIHDFAVGSTLHLRIRPERLLAFNSSGDLLTAPRVGAK